MHSEYPSSSRSNNDGRLQACGWSLPNSPTSSQPGLQSSTSTSESSVRTKVPVPIYCGPVFDDKPNFKVNSFITYLYMVATLSGKSGKKKDKSLEKPGENEGFWKKVIKSQEIW